MSLTLKQKIFYGYVLMVLFTLVVGVYAIWSLSELNKITTDIVFNNVVMTEKLAKLNDCMFSQDLHEKRYLTLRTSDAEELFWNRSREFKTILSELSGMESSLKTKLDEASREHEQYDSIFTQETALLKDGKLREAEALSNDALKQVMKKTNRLLGEVEQTIKKHQSESIGKSNSLGERALMITIVLSTVSFLFGIIFASLLTGHLTSSIERLKAATHSIKSGDFDNLPEIKGADELTDLAISFKEMSTRLKELEEMNLDANPLTKLPGNLAIEKELLTRLNDTERFSFCLADLDNFKAFNDRYGYARGSDVIKWMGEMLTAIKKEFGTPEDFLGHIGGDDFVIICAPERVQAICSKIVEEFDKGIVDFYDPEDKKKGFIVSIDRNDKPAIFGIMTISIPVVNTDRTLIREPKEIALKVAELKQYAKTFAKSLFIMDRRKSR